MALALLTLSLMFRALDASGETLPWLDTTGETDGGAP